MSETSPCECGAPLRVLYEGRDRLCGVPGEFRVVVCERCGIASTMPRLDSPELERYYPPSYPAFRELPPAENDPRVRIGAKVDAARFSATMRFGAFRPLVDRPPGRLLDVGCGRGELAAWFARRGWDVAGVEPGAQACAQAAATGIEAHQGTLDDAPWTPHSFDAITFNHSLEHIPDPVDALRLAHDLLRPHGLVVVSVPNFGCWQRRVFGSRWFHLDLPRHLQHFDAASLTAMMGRAGLTPVSVRNSSSMSGLVGSLQYAISGRASLSDVAFFRLMHLTYPLVALSDVFFAGDCLHVAARAE